MNKLLISRVAFNIFGIDIYWYGIIIAFAILVAYIVACIIAKKRNIKGDIVFEILIAIIPLGIVFARLFAVLFDADLSILDYFNFRSGGMSIIGAIIGGAIGVVLLKLIRKRSFLEVADLIVVVLILAQGIGRWGNFANGEVYGLEVTNPALQFFPFAVNVESVWYEALFFYEFVLNVLGFVLLLVLYNKVKTRGIVTASYLMYYGAIRTILETRRDPKFILRLWGMPISLVVCVIMFVIGLVLLCILLARLKNNNQEKTNGK